jgi:hypothetical protein
MSNIGPSGLGGQLDDYAERARAMLPAAPPGLLDGYVRFAPWVAIIFGVLGVLLLLVLGGVLTVLSPLFLAGGASGIESGFSTAIAIVVGLVASALELVGGYQMLKGKLTGWWLLAFGIALSILRGLFGLSLLGLLFSLAIGYVHLQVKPRYV